MIFCNIYYLNLHTSNYFIFSILPCIVTFLNVKLLKIFHEVWNQTLCPKFLSAVSKEKQSKYTVETMTKADLWQLLSESPQLIQICLARARYKEQVPNDWQKSVTTTAHKTGKTIWKSMNYNSISFPVFMQKLIY